VASLASLVDRVRMEIGDVGKSFVWRTTATGTNRYEMPYNPVLGETLAVFVDGTDVSDSVEVEEHSGILNFDTAPTAGDVISVQGTHFRFFTQAELFQIVDASVRQHLHNRNDAYGRALTVENLPVVEDHPASLLGAINALYTLATDASFDINIQTPDGVSIPRADRYRQLMDAIRARREQYDMLCEALNIGLTRVENFTLRRISRTTNKYIPIYMPQEVDDRSQPLRVYLPIPTYGGSPVPSKAGNYDIVFTQGDSYSVIFDFPFSVDAYVPKAQVRLYPDAAVKVAEFAIQILDDEVGRIELSLTPEQTTKMPLRAFWDLQLTSDDGEYVETFMRGSVFVQRQVTKDTPESGNWSPTGWEQS
jgi:hypothetical protein